MRLIDADALFEALGLDQYNNGEGMTSEEEWIAEAIMTAPTITEGEIVKDYCRRRNYVLVAAEDLYGLAHGAVKPVRRGRWIELAMAGEYKCSVCGRGSRSENTFQVYWNYCPNCGANMEASE